MARDSAGDPEHLDVVAKDLKIVAGVVARQKAFVVEHGLPRVGRHLKMTPKPGGRP